MEREARETDAGALWDFAVRLYAEPGVSDACLALQDRFGVDVPLLLWAAWLGDGADAAALRAGDRAVGPWRARAVRPLRALRLEIDAERMAFGILAEIGRRRGHANLVPFAAVFGLERGSPELELIEAAARRLA